MVHGLMVAGLGRSAPFTPSWARKTARVGRDRSSNVVVAQAVIWPVLLNRLKRKFFYKPPVWGLSGAPSPHRRPRRTGKSAIVNRTTGLWSIWIVASLIFADSGLGLFCINWGGLKQAPNLPSICRGGLDG